jgi:hypothetical protein
MRYLPAPAAARTKRRRIAYGNFGVFIATR